MCARPQLLPDVDPGPSAVAVAVRAPVCAVCVSLQKLQNTRVKVNNTALFFAI